MATLYLHTGMHKTGSSSIQNSLAALPDDRGPRYLQPGPTPNSSGPVKFAFVNNPKRFVKKNVPLASRQEYFRALLSKMLRESRYDDAILSAESFDLMSQEEFESFVGMVRHNNLKIITYVRNPVSAMPSALQERIRVGILTNTDVIAQKLVPKYGRLRERYHGYDVNYVDFSRESLRNNCVVQDLSARIGIEIAPEEVITSNESMCRYATSLLLCRNMWRKRCGLPIVTNHSVIPLMAGLKGPKIEMASDFIKSGVQYHAEGIAWIEKQIGKSWDICPIMKADAISSVRDLLQVPETAREWLAQRVKHYKGEADWHIIGSAVDSLAHRGMAPSYNISQRDDDDRRPA